MNSKSLKDVAKAILEMPYYKNYAASSGAVHNISKHEDALEATFVNNGYQKYNPVVKLKKKDMETPTFLSNMPNGTFICQPFGTHSSPDFYIKGPCGTVKAIEAKSADTYCPLYNSGGIKRGVLYVFCSKKTNTTTIYKGEDIMTSEQQELIDKHIADEKQRVQILNERLKALDSNERGISFYPRPMIGQAGGAYFTNYMTHKNRQRDEQRAIDELAASTIET